MIAMKGILQSTETCFDMYKKKDTVIWMGAGQIGLAIIRRIASGHKIIVGDRTAGKQVR